MDLMTLGPDYQPDKLVERYTSLVWTERYFTSGDFQLVTSDVRRMLKLLPLESLVTIKGSDVPMVVEVHKIEKKLNSAPELTIVGRSFETVLERRVTADSNPSINHIRVAWSEATAKESDAAYHAIRKIIGDVARSPLAAQTPILSPNDALPMINLPLPTDYSSAAGGPFEIKPGNLYTTALELMTTNHHAMKAVRPQLGANQISIQIYNGYDLTNDVVFDAKFEQFDDATYLLSKQGSANWAYVFSKTGSQVVAKNTAPEPTGLNRRVLYLDISSEDGTDSITARQTRGLIELYKFNATALFDGQVSQQVADGYNNKYSLGDIIRLDGEYGLSEFVRVAEFIRSDDTTGSKAYPTFEVVTE